MWIYIKQVHVGAKQLKKLDRSKIEKHRKEFDRGGEVMPIDVVKITADEYCISGNGRHRYFGALAAGMEMIEVNVLNE